MARDTKSQAKSRVVPSWAVAFVALATGGVTVFAMTQAGYRPVWGKSQDIVAPSVLPWSAEANDTLGNLMPVGGQPALPAQTGCPTVNYVPAPPVNASPPMAMAPSPLTPVAAPATAAIDGTIRPPAHGERGVCLNCHAITDAQGNPVPPIRSLSPLPHVYRGVCVNCHSIASQPGTPANAFGPVQPAAAMNPIRPNPAINAPAPTPTEGEWLGMEVAPITPLTSTQFKIAECTSGLVVVEAEAQALTVGLKAGDVLIRVNNTPITGMADFMLATKNGTLPSGLVQVIRGGQSLLVDLSQTVQPPAGVPAAPQPRSASAAGPPLRVQP